MNEFNLSKLQKDTAEFALPSLALELPYAFYCMNDSRSCPNSILCYGMVYPRIIEDLANYLICLNFVSDSTLLLYYRKR